MTNQQGVNWVTVLSFLQKQQTQSIVQEKQWGLQRHQLTDKINRLEAQLDANRILITDLLNRIKLLQIALFEQKYSKPGNTKQVSPKQQDLQVQKIEKLLEKYKMQNKVKETDHKDFLNQILSQIGIDSAQVFPHQDPLMEPISKIYQTHANIKLKQSGSITAHLDAVRKLYVNHSKDFVISISQDCLVKLWSYSSIIKNKNEYLQPSKTFRQHTGPLFALSGGPSPFNPEQSIFFTGGSEGLIKYWKSNNKNYNQSTIPVSTWNCSKFNNSNSVIWDLSLNKNKLLSSSSDSFINLYQVTQNQGNILKHQFKQKQFSPTCIQWLSSQTFIHGCSNAPRAHIWDLNGKIKEKYLYQIPKGNQSQLHQINEISFSKSLKLISFGCEDGAVRIFCTNFNRMLRKIQVNASVSCVKLIKDWQLVCGTHLGSFTIWDLRNYQKIFDYNNCHMQKYDEGILCLWAQSDRMLTGGADGLIKIFN